MILVPLVGLALSLWAWTKFTRWAVLKLRGSVLICLSIIVTLAGYAGLTWAWSMLL